MNVLQVAQVLGTQAGYSRVPVMPILEQHVDQECEPGSVMGVIAHREQWESIGLFHCSQSA